MESSGTVTNTRHILSFTGVLGAVALAAMAACSPQNSPTDPAGLEFETPAVSELDIENVLTDTWAHRPPMPTARSGLVAATVNGVIYAIGGKTQTQNAMAKVEAYNPDGGWFQWSIMAPLPAARSFPSGAAVINGKIYVPGGFNASGLVTRSLFVYNVASNSWTSKAKMPVRSRAGASVAINGKLYVLSGPLPGDPPHSKLHRYDPTTNSWTSRASPPKNLQGAVVGVINGKLYAAGGSSETGRLATLYVYNPSTDQWITKANMPTPRAFAAGRVLGGKLYVAGGINNGLTASTLVYDPATNSWSGKADMLTPRFMAAAAVSKGLLYVLGGDAGGAIALATNDVYIP